MNHSVAPRHQVGQHWRDNTSRFKLVLSSFEDTKTRVLLIHEHQTRVMAKKNKLKPRKREKRSNRIESDTERWIAHRQEGNGPVRIGETSNIAH